MKNFIFGFAVLALSLTGCVTATVTEPNACKSNTLTFSTGLPSAGGPSVTLPPLSAATQVDLSSIISKLDGQGAVHVSISKNVLTTNSGTFSWVKHISVAMAGVHDHNHYPSQTLVDQEINTSSTSLDLVPLLDGDTVYRYLSQGAVELTFTITGTTENTSGLDMTSDFCTSDTFEIKKTL